MKQTMLLFMTVAMLTSSGCATSMLPAAKDRQDQASMGAAPIHFFRTYLSGADGHRCPMTPSCSSYALAAIRRHGAAMGWVMACDRLMRCGRDEIRHSPTVMTRHGVRYRDTLDDNEFWRH